MYEVSQRFLDSAVGSHRAIARVQVLPTALMPQFGPAPVGGVELPLLDGDIKLTSTQDINGTCDFMISGDYWELLQPYGAELFVQRGIDFGDGTSELVPCGYYGIEEISQDKAPSGPVRVSGADRTMRLKRNRVVYPTQFPAGTSHNTIFECLVNGVTLTGNTLTTYSMFVDGTVPITFDGYDGNTAKIATSLTCEDDAHAFLSKLVDAKGCVLRFDRHGQLVVQLRNVPPGAESVYAVRGGSGGNMVAAARRVTRDGVYNYVVARGSDPANPTGYRLAFNDDPISPIRWDGPFGTVIRYYASPLLATNDAADAAAETVLSRYKGLPSRLALLSVPNPALDPLDVVSVQLGTTAATHLIDQVSIPLVGSQAVQIVTRTLNEVLISDDDTGTGGGFPNPPNPGGGGTGGGGGGGGGTGGGGGGSVGTAIPDKVIAAQLILDRLNSGLSIFEDWTWTGAHALVGQYNDPLLAEFHAANPSASSLGTEARTWLADYIARGGVGTGGGTGGGGSTQTLGVGGVATPAGAILATSDQPGVELSITTSGTASQRRVYDGQGHKIGLIKIRASYVTVQNYRVESRQQYGIDCKLNRDNSDVIIQNNDIKDCRPTGDGDLNAMTINGDNIIIAYNTAINFIGQESSGSHTDGIQTWNDDAGESTSNLRVIGNRFQGPPAADGGAQHIHQALIGEGKDSTDGGGGGTGVSENWFVADNYWTADCKFDDIDNVTYTRNTFAGIDKRAVVVTNLSSGFKYYSDNKVTGQTTVELGATVISGSGPATPTWPGGGTSGGGGGGTPTDPGPATMTAKVQAALLIHSRLTSNLAIFEDWSWTGMADIVGANNDALLAEFQADHPSTSSLSATAVAWLADYVASGGTSGGGGGTGGGGGGTGGGTSVAAARNIAVTPASDLANFNMSDNDYICASRFELDQVTVIDRFYFIINGEGSDLIGGRDGYGNGTGGTWYGRIVEVNQTTGLPTTTVLASETVGAAAAHSRAMSEFGIDLNDQIHWVQFTAVTLQPGRMYAFLLSNTASNPGDGGGASSGNHMSVNLNMIVSLSAIGPNGRNTLDKTAPGAVAGLGPRECTMWSNDSGSTWKFGDEVGWYHIGSGEGRLWPCGYRIAGGNNVTIGWPYLNWPDDESGRNVTYHGAPLAVTLTRAGGASHSSSVGVVTVTNLTTGVSGTTSNLGSGMVAGQLNPPVPVAAGQSFRISAAGSTAMGDPSDTASIFNLGSQVPWDNDTNGSNGYVPMLWASPWPFFANSAPAVPSTGGGGSSMSSMSSILRLGKAPGLTKVNIGVDYLPNQGPSGKQGTHVDHLLAEIENNLTIPGYVDIRTDGAVRLTSYVGAATTPNSTHSRTEFRELATDGVAKAAWSSTSGEHYVWCKGAVIRQAPGRPHVVIAQIHGADDDVGTIRVEGTTVVSTYGDAGRPGTLATGLVLGSVHEWMIKTIRSESSTIIQYFWDDLSTPKATQSYSGGSGNYFKAGSYHQSTTSDDDQGDSFIVDLYDMEIWHTGYPTPTARH